MSKSLNELATEITVATIKAKADVLSNVEHGPSKKEFTEKWLSDEAITKTYKNVLEAMLNA